MVTGSGVAGFWSYAHEDNRLDGGGILRLAELLKNEFALIAGREIEIFVDVNDISWGQEWRERIDGALKETTFLIPIVTPRYFNRPECVRELIDFHGMIKRAGLDKLLLPILYADVPDLAKDSANEVKSIIARTQFTDWRSLRLESPESAAYRKAVNSLALRLFEIDREISDIQIQDELDEADNDLDDSSGLADVMRQIEELLPDWLESVLDNKVFIAQLKATFDQHMERMEQLRLRGSGNSAKVATQTRFGEDMLKLNRRFERDVEVYLARSIELDPLARRLLEILSAHPEDIDAVSNFSEAVIEALENFALLESHPTTPQDQEPADILRYLDSIKHKSRTIKQVISLVRQSREAADRGNEIVARWWNSGLGELVRGERFSPIERVRLNWWLPTTPNS